MKINYLKITLWIALLLALFGSLKHTAWSFSTLEDGDLKLGYIQAVAVEAGLATLAYGIQQKKKQRRPTKWLWLGVIGFSLISAYANMLHGLVYSGPLDLPASWQWMDALRPVLLSSILPALVIYLAEIVSSEQVYDTEQARKEERRAARSVQASVSPMLASETRSGYPAPIEQAREAKLEQLKHSKEETLDRMTAILDTDPDIEITELSKIVNRSRTTVYKYLEELEEAGRVRRDGQKMLQSI